VRLTGLIDKWEIPQSSRKQLGYFWHRHVGAQIIQLSSRRSTPLSWSYPSSVSSRSSGAARAPT
jgi:hypothetical protein